MFTFMFLSYPSGLVIYWTISNLWAIGQQYLTTSLVAPAKAKSWTRTWPIRTEIADFVQSVAEKMGLRADGNRRRDGRRPPHQPRGRGRVACSPAGRARRWPPCSTSCPRSTATRPPRAAGWSWTAGLSPGQGRRTAADGDLPRREGEDHRPGPGDRSAQPVRTPHRPHGGVGDRGHLLREHRRRLREDRHHLGSSRSQA